MTKKRRAPAPDEAPIVTRTLLFIPDDGADGGSDDDAAGIAGSDEMELSAREVVVGMSVVPPLRGTSLDVVLETIVLKRFGHRGYIKMLYLRGDRGD